MYLKTMIGNNKINLEKDRKIPSILELIRKK